LRPSRGCRRANAQCSCSAMCSAGLRMKPLRCSAARQLRSTARCSGRARHWQNVIPKAGRRPRQKLLARYMKAWEELDLDNFVALLKEDATYTMPPLPQWYLGREVIRTFFAFAFKTYGGFRMVPTAANGEPAFAAYSRKDANSPWNAHSIHVLTLEQEIISRLTLFYKPDGPRLFDAFGLPLVPPE